MVSLLRLPCSIRNPTTVETFGHGHDEWCGDGSGELSDVLPKTPSMISRASCEVGCGYSDSPADLPREAEGRIDDIRINSEKVVGDRRKSRIIIGESGDKYSLERTRNRVISKANLAKRQKAATYGLAIRIHLKVRCTTRK